VCACLCVCVYVCVSVSLSDKKALVLGSKLNVIKTFNMSSSVRSVHASDKNLLIGTLDARVYEVLNFTGDGKPRCYISVTIRV